MVVDQPPLILAASQCGCYANPRVTNGRDNRKGSSGSHRDGLGARGPIGEKGLRPNGTDGVDPVVSDHTQVADATSGKINHQLMVTRSRIGQIPGFNPVTVVETGILADIRERNAVISGV